MEGRVCRMGDSMPILSSTPWEWIVEQLVDNKDLSTPLLKAMITNIPDFSNRSLQERVALRYLEEILLLGKFEAPAIPLVKLLLPAGHDLLLRVSTEVVLGHIRCIGQNGERDWKGFEDALNRLFPEQGSSVAFINRRNELLRVLEDKSIYLSTLEKHPIEALKCDLLHFVRQKKACLNRTFLDQLADDVFEGHYSSASSLHHKHAPRSEECITAGGRKRFHREANLASENTGSKDMYVECRPEIHDDGDTGIVQILSETESTADGQCHHQGGNQNLPDLEEGMIEPEQEKDSEATDRSRDHSPEAEWIPELENLTIGKDGHEELCHKCKRGGELSRCNGCPIAVHESCIETDIDITAGNGFYCPVCSYKRALVAFKKAKEVVVDSRKRLYAFIDRVQDHGESSLGYHDKPKREGRISTGKGQNLKKPSGVLDSMDSKKAQLHPHRKICRISINEDKTSDGPGNGPSVIHIDSQDDCPDEDLNEGTSGAAKYHLRYQRPSMRGNTICHGLRRKAFPWTKAEEECLKEGVQRFSSKETRVLPWKRILEFGQGKFHNTRTSVDLKNKWWSMKKDVS